VKALALSESDLQGLHMEMHTTKQSEPDVVSFKNADGTYNRTISILCAQLGTVGGMSAATLSRNMKTIIEDVTGKTLDPSNKFSQHFMSDTIYLAEGLSQEACKTIMEEEAEKIDAPGWTVGHDGTQVYGNEIMHYNVTVGGQDLTLGIIPTLRTVPRSRKASNKCVLMFSVAVPPFHPLAISILSTASSVEV
jgi:hypothetical protein